MKRGAGIAMLAAVVSVSLGGYTLLGPLPCSANSNEVCLGCHGSRDILTMSAEDRASQVVPVEPGKTEAPRRRQRVGEVSLFVDPAVYAGSVHAGQDCVACHQDAEEVPHKSKLLSANCETCHGDVSAQFSSDAHGRALAKEAETPDAWFAPLCQDCHGSHDIKPTADPSSRVHPLNQTRTCSQCHQDQDLVARYRITIPAPVKAYERSTHARAVAMGNFKAAACSSCHSAHTIRPAGDPQSTISRANEPVTCGKCHQEETRKYQGSIHGLAAARGNFDSPVCSGCHNEHEILSPKERGSVTHAATLSTATCARCHGAEKINRKYGLPMDKVRTYLDSYHGLSTRMGDTTAANCASCHGLHDIRPSADPSSKTNPANLTDTCGKCHPGATARFAAIPVHTAPAIEGGGTGEQVQYWVRLFYYIMIPLTLAFMLFHNAIDYLKKMRVHYANWRARGGYLRMTRSERIQHLVLMVSFTLLVLSGFALTYQWGLPFVSGETNQALRSHTHRVAAVVFMGYVVFHIAWLGGTRRGRTWFRDMIPVRRDLRDLKLVTLYNLGLAPTKPKFARFNYVQKLEYYALLWGSVLMIATGFILWFQKEATAVIPPWGFNVANLIHFYEAFLAAFAILIWHFYAVIYDPDTAPMAMQWLAGTVPAELLQHEHTVEPDEGERPAS